MLLPDHVIDHFRVDAREPFRLADHDPGWHKPKELRELGRECAKEVAEGILATRLRELTRMQALLWANDRWSVLVILQGLDASGKDGIIEHVMSGMNPQGCTVSSFKAPSAEELDHDFLWRCARHLPERGRLGIFNRSWYEDVLVVRVHPELLERAKLPDAMRGKPIWRHRYESIADYERHLVRNGTVVLKFFLHLSKAEQKKRFLARLTNPDKHWKFSVEDIAERGHWPAYQRAYADAIAATSTTWAPWYVVPADHKWVARAVVADVLARTIRDLRLRWPRVDAATRKRLAAARRTLERERG